MYEKVCSKKKWNLEIINISKSEAGGFKEVIFSVNGNDIYSYLKYESGVHRVQRIPETETQETGLLSGIRRFWRRLFSS